VPKLSEIYDEPFADSSQIPTNLVSDIARRDVTVCLSGDGGDELFSGYNRYIWSDSIWNKMQNIPLPARKLFSYLLQLPKPEFWDNLYRFGTQRTNADEMKQQRMIGLKLQKLCGFIVHDNLDDAYQYLLSYWEKPEILLKSFGIAFETQHDYELPDTEDFIEQAMYMDQMSYLPGDNLAKVDRASMSVSLETRLPLLSHEIAEFSWRVPRSMKLRDGKSKWLLRQVLYKYVPAELIDRPKMGFTMPVASWLRNELYEWANDMLAGSGGMNNNIIDEQQIRKTWDDHLNGRKDNALKLWSVLMYLAWAERSDAHLIS
jgi:asparagine synthase (glutamine-hydrolysing)